jgi:hypothetical protein
LAQPLEPVHNFVNFYAFGNGVYDSTFPVYQSGQFNNPTSDQGAWGYEVGGGVTASHEFKHGSLLAIAVHIVIIKLYIRAELTKISRSL